jgi:F0F1-type ATP synthase assembly protein I
MNPYQRYIGAAFQMLVTILLGVWLGRYLDAYFEFQKPWLTLTGSLLGIAVAMIGLIRSLPK